jgi:hypothetical protein
MPKPAPPVDADQETAEETAEAAAPQASNWETIYLATSAIMLLVAIVVVLYAAGHKYNVGPFKQG